MLPQLPVSWSSLTWQQLCSVWQVKQLYGGQPNVAVCAALLRLLRLTVEQPMGCDDETGEYIYLLRDPHGNRYTVTPRHLAHLAHTALPWFDYPYGDPGQEEKRDKQGKVTQEFREAHLGYVGPLRDAMMLPIETVTVSGTKVFAKGDGRKRWRTILHSSLFTLHSRKVFALPQVACNNLTWQQYRSLQAITPQLWRDGISDDEAIDLMAQFMAHILVPRSLALFDQNGGTIRLHPHHTFRYDPDRAETLIPYWRHRLRQGGTAVTTLFHICHQVWQTSLAYYNKAYPMLFNGSSKKSGPMQDALQGEVGTVNTIMKYAGYAEQQQVYDSNLPFVLDILNTMTKEAKEIEAVNAKAKRKK